MLFLLAHLALYLLCQAEHLAWCLRSFAENDGVEKSIVRFEAPGFRLDERRLAHHRPYPFADEKDSLSDIGLAVAEIRPQSKINLMR